MYNEPELKRMTNAALNRIIDTINSEIKRRKLRKPRVKKGGNKQSKINRILGYYAPKPPQPEPVPEPEPEPGDEGIYVMPLDEVTSDESFEEMDTVTTERLEIGDKMTATLRGPDGEVKSTTTVSDEAEAFFSNMFATPTSTPSIRETLANMKDGMLNDREFVKWAYYKVLGRGPDPVGWEVYVGHLKQKTLNREGLIQALFSSEEFRTKRAGGFYDTPKDETG